MDTIINDIKKTALNGDSYYIINDLSFEVNNNKLFNNFIIKKTNNIIIIEWNINDFTDYYNYYSEIVNITRNAIYYKNIKKNISNEINKMISKNNKISHVRIMSDKEKELMINIIKNNEFNNIKMIINEHVYCKWSHEQYDELVIIL